MQTLLEALTIYPLQLEAANEEFVVRSGPFDSVSQWSGFGWDPYEVWRTRIKEGADPQDQGGRKK